MPPFNRSNLAEDATGDSPDLADPAVIGKLTARRSLLLRHRQTEIQKPAQLLAGAS